jgi:hypothetical protein
MTDPIPSNVFVAIATVVAAVIAGLISVVTLTLTKEQKISDFRQAWIDGLRQDLSEFFASARAMARASEELATFGSQYASMPFTMPAAQIAGIRQAVAVAFYRIKLRLNVEETEHKELLRLLSRVTEEQNQQLGAPSFNVNKVLQAVETASEYARPVLKAEWNQVKRGEPQFRLVRNWLVPMVFLLCALFAWLLVSVRIAA